MRIVNTGIKKGNKSIIATKDKIISKKRFRKNLYILENIREVLENKELLDFGVCVKPDFFEFSKSYCTLPTSSVMLYALAIANSGKAKKIYLAGFDGYPDGDCRNDETNTMFQSYNSVSGSIELIGITPSKYRLKLKSIYGLLMGNVKGI